jgi:hypothetical protein
MIFPTETALFLVKLLLSTLEVTAKKVVSCLVTATKFLHCTDGIGQRTSISLMNFIPLFTLIENFPTSLPGEIF